MDSIDVNGAMHHVATTVLVCLLISYLDCDPKVIRYYEPVVGRCPILVRVSQAQSQIL